jgi:hypothetical protein
MTIQKENQTLSLEERIEGYKTLSSHVLRLDPSGLAKEVRNYQSDRRRNVWTANRKWEDNT